MVYKKGNQRPSNIEQTPEIAGRRILIESRFAQRGNEHKAVKLLVDFFGKLLSMRLFPFNIIGTSHCPPPRGGGVGGGSSVLKVFLEFLRRVLESTYLRIKISKKPQRFDVSMTSFSREKIKFKLT